MFRGSYEHGIDAKGRVAFPSALREEVVRLFEDEGLFATKHLRDRCLVIYPAKEWEAFEAKVAAQPIFDKSAERIRRLLIGPARPITIDPQGRVLIPQELRVFAGLEKDVLWLGGGRIVELWSKDNHEKFLLETEAELAAGEMEGLLARAAELGL